MRIVWVILVLMASGVMAQGNRVSKSELMRAQADTLLVKENYKAAVKLYEKIIKSTAASNYGDLLYRRAFCYYKLEDYTRAIRDLSAYISTSPETYQAQYLRAVINHELGNTDDELADLNNLITLFPDYVELIRWRAGTLVDLGRYPEARNDLEILSETESSEEIELYLGLTYYYSDEPEEALIHFDKSIQINGQYVPGYIYAGSVCLDREDFDKALTYINLGLRLDPENMDLMFYKGVALVEKNNLDYGCSCLAKAFYKGIDDAKDYLTEFCYGDDE